MVVRPALPSTPQPSPQPSPQLSDVLGDEVRPGDAVDVVAVVEGLARTPGAFDRRTALGLSAAVVAVATIMSCERCDTPAAPKADDDDEDDEDRPRADNAVDAFVPVLVAMAERLVPSDDLGPGAKEAQLEPFFRAVFADDRLATVHPLLKRGAAFLMKVARGQANSSFVGLDALAQDDLITRLATNQMRPPFPGPLFVRIVLALTLEGFLGDPKHGGNANKVGWRFVAYDVDSRAGGQALPILKNDPSATKGGAP